MTRSSSEELFEPLSDPEKLQRIRKRFHEAGRFTESTSEHNTEQEEPQPETTEQMGENHQNLRTISDYSRPTLNDLQPSVTRPAVAANNFEIKPAFISMLQNTVQFDGLPDEDPNQHIASFLEICDTFKMNGISVDAIRLRLFPFSLRNRAKTWLTSLPPGSITTWEGLAEKFLLKYFPPAKTAKLRNDISSFAQFDGESLYDTWERFKDLLRKCPHHGLPTWMQVQSFYNGLTTETRQMIDAASGGNLTNKSPEQAIELIEEMSINNYQWHSSRSKPAKSGGVYQVDALSALSAQVEALSHKIEHLHVKAVQHVCDFCGGGHLARDCQTGNMFAQAEQVDYLGNPVRPQAQPYGNTYNPSWRNHPNFSWKGSSNQPPGFQARPLNQPQFLQQYQQSGPSYGQNPVQPTEKKPSVEDMLAQIL